MKNSFIGIYPFISRSTCILLFVLAVINCSTAQTPQYYNFNTTGTSNSFPFNLPAGKEVQWLYLPGDFNQPAPAPAGKITSIYFRISDSYPLGPWTYSNLTIKMGQSDITAFTPGSFYAGTLDTVYFRASVSISALAGQWMTIVLDTPFVYDTVKSLILDVGQCGVPGATGYSMSQSILSGYRRVYSAGGCPFAPSNADARIAHLGLDICPKPSAPVNITSPADQTICSGNSTTLSVSGTGTLGWYSEETGGMYLGTGTSYTTSALLSDTTYFVQDSACGFISSRTAITVAVNPAYSFTEDISICEGETFNWQGTDYTTTDTYTESYTSVNGCDSIYSLNLTINPVYSFTEDISICEGESYTWRGNDYTTTDTYTESYTSVNGCDSIYTLNLTVNPVYSFSEDHTICEGETYNWQGDNFTTADTYTAGYTSINGCDSVYTLNLTVNPTHSFAENHSICDGEIYTWQGTDYTTADTYTARYTSITGCDSIYTLILTVNTVDVSVDVNESVITANAIGSVYQWLDCDNALAPVNGAALQSYNPTESGHYAVRITQGSCSDTSDCTPMVISGIASFPTEGLTVYPNPVSNELIIEIKGNQEKMDFEILNSTGQVVYKGSLLQKTEVNTSEFNSGVYLVKIESGKTFIFKKIIKE